jgi:hypothetical protein
MANPITLDGIKVKKLNLEYDESGKLNISGSYDILASNGKVIAKQSFGEGYGVVKFTPDSHVIKTIEDVLFGLSNNVNRNLGFGE